MEKFYFNKNLVSLPTKHSGVLEKSFNRVRAFQIELQFQYLEVLVFAGKTETFAVAFSQNSAP